MKKRKYVLAVALMLASLACKAQMVDLNQVKPQPLDHFWSVGVCAGRANEGLRTSWVEQLKLAKHDGGFRYLRMHGLFDDDMFVYFEGKDGTPRYNWQYIDEVYDRLLDMGIRPFVELSFFPKGNSSGSFKVADVVPK